MSAEPWDYFVPYEEDVRAVLEKLRQREFLAGRYRRSQSGMKSATLEEAIVNADPSGTASILDMVRVADTPDYSTLAPLSEAELVRCFRTTRPTRRMIEDNLGDASEEEDDLYQDIGRGQGIYVIVYQGDQPSEIFFGGYSYD